jgi:transposase-like protein
MNPYNVAVAINTIKEAMKQCPHCGRSNVYEKKKPGQFYQCKNCLHRFKERGR